MRRLRRDRHRQPDQERHPGERSPLLARRRHRPPEPLGAHARHTLKHKVLLLGGPNTYLPFLQECWRLRIPQTWDERGYDYPKDMPDRGARSSSPRTRSTTRPSAPCSTACTRTATSARSHGARRPPRVHDERAQGAPRRDRGPAARRRPRRSSTTSSELYAIPKFVPDEVRAGRGRARGHRPRRRLDVEQGRPRRLRGRQDPLQGLPALEGQPDPGHEGAPRPAPRRTSRRPGGQARGHGLRRDGLRGRRARRSACAPT